MRILITGINGFVGRHLARHIADQMPDAQIEGTVLQHPIKDWPVHTLDLRDRQAVYDLVQRTQPDRIYHLAALSSPYQSTHSPWETVDNNVRGQVNLLQACMGLKNAPRILIVSSGDIYQPDPDGRALDEHSPFNPTTPYAVSKIAQDMIAQQYSYHLPVFRARPFNHTGPGQQAGFVAPDFAMQVAAVEAGQQEPVIRVRNLASQVDFTDVRDVVRAYRLIIEQGTPGEVYNIASGQAYSIRYLLDTLISASTLGNPPTIEVSGPQIPSIKRGDASRLHTAVGWRPTIAFEQTVRDLLDDCRARIMQG